MWTLHHVKIQVSALNRKEKGMKLRRKENTEDEKKFIIRVGAQNMRENDRGKKNFFERNQ